MQAFRVKPIPSHELSHSSPGLSKHTSQPSFPFHNRKIQAQKQDKDIVEIKPYKSRAQVTRKRLESIPLLKNLRLDHDKISIFKSAKNEYNLYLRKSAMNANYNEKVMVVNGEEKSHKRSISDQCRRRQIPTHMDSFRVGSSWTFRQGSGTLNYDKNFLLTMPERPQTLYVSGKQKSISPSRGSLRSGFHHQDDYQLRL